MSHFLSGHIGRSVWRVLGGAWLLTGTMAMAQPAAPPQTPAEDQSAKAADAAPAHPEDITVTGNPERQAIIKQMTQAISRPHDRQLARFSSEVCFHVGGVNAPYDRIMAERMEQDARDAGLTVGKQGCRPNIVVVLADHVQAELERLAKEGRVANSLGLLDKELKQAAQGPGPAYVVTTVEERSSEGIYMRMVPGEHPSQIIHDSSIINPPTRQDIITVLVGIESEATMGKTLRQLADYAALRALADIKGAPVVAGAEPSILGLFDAPATLTELTSYDRAYLKGLYHGPAAMRGSTRMHEIVMTNMKNTGR